MLYNCCIFSLEYRRKPRNQLKIRHRIEPLSPNGWRTIQSARFVLINGFSLRINNQLHQNIDKYYGALGLAWTEQTHLCVEAARPSMLVVNALFLKSIPHIDYDIKMRIHLERIGQFMMGTPDYTAMGRSMQILRQTGLLICSRIRRPRLHIKEEPTERPILTRRIRFRAPPVLIQRPKDNNVKSFRYPNNK